MQLEARPREFFYQLESLRGVAALLVVSFHCAHYFPPFNDVMIFGKGYIMVDMFFVLSGFVIYHSYENSINNAAELKRFIVLRLGRIYPLHFFTTIIWLFAPLIEYLTGDYGLNKSTFSFSNTIANFLLIHNWGFEHFGAINAPSWSISTEFFAYLFFACFLIIFKKNFKVVLYFTALFCGAMVYTLHSDSQLLALSRCLFSFSLGSIIGILYKRFTKRELMRFIPAPWVALLILIVAMEVLFRLYSLKEYVLFPIISSLLILSLLIYPKSIIVKGLQQPALVKIGTLSYSIYMTHGIAITFLVRLFHKLNIPIETLSGSLFLILCIFAFTYMLSVLTYKYIEKVFRDKIRNWISTSSK